MVQETEIDRNALDPQQNPKVYASILARFEYFAIALNAGTSDSLAKKVLAGITNIVSLSLGAAKARNTYVTDNAGGRASTSWAMTLHVVEAFASSNAIWASALTGTDSKEQEIASYLTLSTILLFLLQSAGDIPLRRKQNEDEANAAEPNAGPLTNPNAVAQAADVAPAIPAPSSPVSNEAGSSGSSTGVATKRASNTRKRPVLINPLAPESIPSTSRHAGLSDKNINPFPVTNIEFLNREMKLRSEIGYAEIYEHSEDIDRAIRHYIKAIKTKEMLMGQKIDIVSSSSGPTLDSYKQALGLTASSTQERQADDLSYRGVEHYVGRRLPQAIVCFKKALDANKRLGRIPEQASSHGHLGCAYQEQKQHKLALQHYKDADKLDDQVDKDSPGRANNCSNIAGVFHIKARQAKIGNREADAKAYFDDALLYYKKALSINTKINAHEGIASTHGNLGRLYQDFHRFGDAIKSYRNALSAFAGRNMPIQEGTASRLLNATVKAQATAARQQAASSSKVE